MAMLRQGVLHHHFLLPKAFKHVPSPTIRIFKASNVSATSLLNNNMSSSQTQRCYSSKAVDKYGTNGVARVKETFRERYIHHFLLKEEDTVLLEQLQHRLESGEPLAAIVLDYSYICPNPTGSENIGESLVEKHQLLKCPEFAKVVFEAPCWSIVRCKTRFGWHLIDVTGQRDTDDPVKSISSVELHKKLQDPLFYEEAQLIDVREPEEVSKASLPGFQVFPLSKFKTWSRDVTTKLDPSKDTYVMCHHGINSDIIANSLQLRGFESIYNVVGGIHAYAKDVDPSIPTYKETRVCKIPYAIEKISCKMSDWNGINFNVCDCDCTH